MSCSYYHSYGSCYSQCGCYWNYYSYSSGGYCTGSYCGGGGSGYYYRSGPDFTGLGVFFLVYFILSGIVGGIIFTIDWIKRRENKANNPENNINDDDKNEITDPMNMSFEKRFLQGAEHDIIRKIISYIYWGSRKGCFNVLSVLFGVIFSMFWGFILGFYSFILTWFILPYIDIGKRMYLPCGEIIGEVMNGLYGQCLRNLRPAGKHKMDDPSDNDENDTIGDVGGTKDDVLGMKFITAFPKSDEFKYVRTIEEVLYEVFRIGAFNILVILVGFPFSIIWGLIYGLIQFVLIWWIRPVLKCAKLPSIPLARVIGSCLNAIYGKCLRNARTNPVDKSNNSNSYDIDINDDVKEDEVDGLESETPTKPPSNNTSTYQAPTAINSNTNVNNNGEAVNVSAPQQNNIAYNL